MVFYKMDGAGNDFVVYDNRSNDFNLNQSQIAHLCHRRFGIGADGLMTLNNAPDGYDFEMHYYNSDGRIGSMCGNGGRCIAMMAHLLGMGNELNFIGYDGPHRAVILQWDKASATGIVDLQMRDVSKPSLRQTEGGYILDTGSPHFVLEVSNVEQVDVAELGRYWRYRNDLFPEGANIDFVEHTGDDSLKVRTYERGVEDETWACGTGVTACAIALKKHHISSRGGDFIVHFNETLDSFSNVHLIGPVSLNFTCQWTYFQA